MILTCYHGRNADLVQKVSQLYFPPGAKIADVTYGNGWFWKKIDLAQYEFYPSDIKTGVDFRSTPHPDNYFDIVVFDPPYTHGGSESFVFSHKYNNAALNGVNHKHVMELYAAGMEECRRILKPKGLLLVKCQDEVAGGSNKWSHIEIHQIAIDFGLQSKDLFILHSECQPLNRHRNRPQLHARKNHSYLWVFRKKFRTA